MSLSDDMKVKVTQSCPTPCDPMDYTVHGVLKARILEWVAFPFSRGLSQPRNWTGVSCIAGGFFINWAIRQALLMMQHDTKRIWNSPRIKRTMCPLRGILKLTFSFLQGEGDQRAPNVLMCSFGGWRKISWALNPKGTRGSMGRTVCSDSGFAQREDQELKTIHLSRREGKQELFLEKTVENITATFSIWKPAFQKRDCPVLCVIPEDRARTNGRSR